MRRILIVFGAGGCLDPEINPLPGAEPDCEKFGELLAKHAGFEVIWLVGREK